jgi:hypothetical protein
MQIEQQTAVAMLQCSSGRGNSCGKYLCPISHLARFAGRFRTFFDNAVDTPAQILFIQFTGAALSASPLPCLRVVLRLQS